MSDPAQTTSPSQDSLTESSPDSLASRLAKAVPSIFRDIVAKSKGGESDPGDRVERVDDASTHPSGLSDGPPTLTDDDYRLIIDDVFEGSGIKLYDCDYSSLIRTGKTAVEKSTKRGFNRGKNQLPSKADPRDGCARGCRSQIEGTSKATWSDTDTVNLVKELAKASNLSEGSKEYQAVLTVGRTTASFNETHRTLSNHQMRSTVQAAVNRELDKIESTKSAEGGQASVRV